MKYKNLLFPLVLTLLSFSLLAAQERSVVAVPDTMLLDSDILPSASSLAAEGLNDMFRESSRYETVDRQLFKNIGNSRSSGRVDYLSLLQKESYEELGLLLEADYLCLSSLEKEEGGYRLTAELLQLSTGSVLVRDANHAESLEELVKVSLLTGLHMAGGALAAPVPAPAPKGFVYVKGGTFLMGSPEGEEGREESEVQHSVTLTRDFYMGQFEVTQALWEEVMGCSVRTQRDKASPSWYLRGVGSQNPIYYVSWNEAVEFCNALSLREGLTPAYSGSGENLRCDFDADGYRLPTEAEWEYAARGGQYASGYQAFAGSDNPDISGWNHENSGNITHRVGQKIANPLGLYDMSGNLFEWCWDWSGDYSLHTIDPTGTEKGSLRTVRGGSWYQQARDCRSASRYANYPGYRSDNLGFRIVRSVQADPEPDYLRKVE
ncbi:MAG: formylglycine-generating enzyme family protein [Spirochaetales bacterium]|nr:formylglycine-generating enzyme family protein [Spirochaetales bacterium]